jgi:1-acyl-sn-glycerol-3-phosphate acyltransferase
MERRTKLSARGIDYNREPQMRMTTDADITRHSETTVHANAGRGLRRAFEYFARAVFRFYARLEIAAGEPLPAEPFLLCSNHASHMDAVVLMVAAGLPFESFRLLAAADYFDPQSATGRLTRVILNIVAIDRTSGHSTRLRQTVAECAELIRTDHVRLIAFPEGTRSTTGELRLPFKRGSAFLAVALGVPIVPAYIDGARNALPKGAWVPRPRPIQVRFGRPIRPADWAAVLGLKARCDFVTHELERRIGDLARGR